MKNLDQTHTGVSPNSHKVLFRSLRRLLRWRTCVKLQKRSFRTVFLSLFVLLFTQLTGCIVGPDYAQPGLPGLADDFFAKRAVSSSGSIALSQWWQSFNDPTLDSLLQEAQSQNLTLQESYERIVEARANLRLQGGQLEPNGNLISEYSYRKNSQNARQFVGPDADPFNLFTLGADVSWELDLFGKIRRSIEAADAELAFEQEDYRSVRQTLFADIVSSYLNIRLLQSQVGLIERSLSLQNETVMLVSQRMQAGVTTELDRTQTESFQHRTTALLASIRQQVEIEFNNLGVLLGRAPDSSLREFVGMQPLPAIPPIPHMGLPAELLRRRPDVIRQEMAVRAASARIGIAEADLYPQLSLLGTIAVRATNVSGLFETGGLDFDVGPSFSWNILHFGRIFDNIAIQQSLFRQSIARYQDTVLSAVREVEDAIINHQGNLEQFESLNRAAIADEKSVQLSLERYRAGKANFQRVLDAQQQLLDDQRQGFMVQAAAITQLVRLYKAVGGSWELGVSAGSTTVLASDFATDLGAEVFDTMVDPIYLEPTSFDPIYVEPAYTQLVPIEPNTPQRYPINEGTPLDNDALPFDDEFFLDFQ